MASGAGEFDFSVRGGTRYELHHTLRPPFEILQVVIFNMALVLAGWFILGPAVMEPEALASLVFLPAVLASWAFADVPTTNLYGSQPARALAALGHPERLRNLIMSRDLVLWLLVAPATAILSFALAFRDDDIVGSAAVAAVVIILPFGALGLASIMAPLLPYHAIPLRERRQLRHTWFRWGCAVCIPYFLIGPSAVIILLPATVIVEEFGRTTATWIACLLITTGWTVAVRWLSVAITLRLTHRRREWLTDYLQHPERG